MNNLPKEVLRRILSKYGKDVAGNPKRCENLLNDLCGSYRREINVLVNAAEERVPFDLLAAADTMPLELLLTRLEDQTALTGEAARWAVESWAFALNLATESDIEKRQNQTESATPPVSKRERIVPSDSAGTGSFSNYANPAQPPPKPSRVQPPPRTAPPVRQQPLPAPKSPPIFPSNIQTANQPPIAQRSFGFIRGCLIVFFLLITISVTLIFGVPYAIEVMRETQRERNNEPPRFPVR